MPSTATRVLDGLSTSVAVKAPCRIDAVNNITLAGLQTVHGVAVVEGDRVLCVAQNNAIENGIYVASTGQWQRALDFDGQRDAVTGTIVLIQDYAGAGYELVSPNPVVFGSSQINFEGRDFDSNLRGDLADGTTAGKGSDLVAFNRTDAEISAGITPSNYKIPNHIISGGVVYPERYGLDEDAVEAVNNTALLRAVSVATYCGGANIQARAGVFKFNTLITVPSNVGLHGVGNGYGSSKSTEFEYTGTGQAIQVGTDGGGIAVDGFYVNLYGFLLTNSGTGTIGIGFAAVHARFERITVTAKTSNGFSTAGIKTSDTFGVYALYMYDVYLSGNKIGLDYTRGTDLKCFDCYFESNGRNLRIGATANVTNVAIYGGENVLFGKNYAGYNPLIGEDDNSIGIEIVLARAVVIHGMSMEANGGAIATSTAQRCIKATDTKSLTIGGGNHFHGGSLATAAVRLEAAAKGVKFEGNEASSFNGYMLDFANGASFEVGLNVNTNGSCTGVWNNAWTPVFTALTVVNGTGGVTITGTWERKANTINWWIKIGVTGTATSASSATNTFAQIATPLPPPIDANPFGIMDQDLSVTFTPANGIQFTSNSGRIFTPGWAAANKNIFLKGSYLAAEAT